MPEARGFTAPSGNFHQGSFILNQRPLDRTSSGRCLPAAYNQSADRGVEAYRAPRSAQTSRVEACAWEPGDVPSPHHIDRVPPDIGVATHKAMAFHLRLCYKGTVERILVMWGQVPDSQCMVEGQRQWGELVL